MTALHSEGMTVGEIAGRLCIPEEAVRDQIRDAWARGVALGEIDALASKPGRRKGKR